MNENILDKIVNEIENNLADWRIIKLNKKSYLTDGNVILVNDTDKIFNLESVEWCYPLLYDKDNSSDLMYYICNNYYDIKEKSDFLKISDNLCLVKDKKYQLFVDSYYINELNWKVAVLVKKDIYLFNNKDLIAILPCYSKGNFIDM